MIWEPHNPMLSYAILCYPILYWGTVLKSKPLAWSTVLQCTQQERKGHVRAGTGRGPTSNRSYSIYDISEGEIYIEPGLVYLEGWRADHGKRRSSQEAQHYGSAESLEKEACVYVGVGGVRWGDKVQMVRETPTKRYDVVVYNENCILITGTTVSKKINPVLGRKKVHTS